MAYVNEAETQKDLNENEKRLIWLDIAKGLAIILVIIGHTLKFGTYPRNIIFSFHMPLFFILTGFTIKIPVNKIQWYSFIKKDFIRIVLPYLGVAFFDCLVRYLLYHNASLLDSLLTCGQAVFWGSGVVHNSHPTIRALWFLIVLFWSKQIYRVIESIFRKTNNIVIYVMIVTVFVFKLKYLPQSIDIALLAVFYLHFGRILRENFECFTNYSAIICCVGGVFWGLCLQNNIYIEMANRKYPHFWISIIEAVVASLCIINLSSNIERFKKWTYFLQWAGINSLYFLCVHYLDWAFVKVWLHKSLAVSCISRSACVFLLVYVLLFLKGKIRRN